MNAGWQYDGITKQHCKQKIARSVRRSPNPALFQRVTSRRWSWEAGTPRALK